MVHMPRPGERLTLSVLSRQLGHYHPLDSLAENLRVLVAARGDQRQVPAGQVVVDPQNDDHCSYFLLSGTVALIQPDGALLSFDSESDRGRRALEASDLTGPLQALSDCQVLQIKSERLVGLIHGLPSQGGHVESPNTSEESDPLYEVLVAIHGHLQSNRLQLPSLPDVAWRVRRVADQENSTAEDVAEVLSADPAMVVNLIQAANSTVFSGFSETHALRDAVVRLGVETTRELVTVFALRELFQTDEPVSRLAMVRLWEHTREVAAVSWALARAVPGVNPEEAMLAGLLHGVGAIPIVQYAERYPNLCADEKELCAAIEALQGEVGGAILRHWGFSETVCETAEQAGQWHFDSGDDGPRLVDVVLIAQMHALINQNRGDELPVFLEVPAFTRLGVLSLTPEKSLRVLLAAREQIDLLKSLLSGQSASPQQGGLEAGAASFGRR